MERNYGASGASVPVAGDVVFIEGGFNVTLNANAACASLAFTTVTANFDARVFS
jgi:hypothetical protein